MPRLPLIAAAVPLLGLALWPARPLAAADPPQGPVVVVVPVRERAVGTDRSYVGTIRADRRGRVGVEVAGYVEWVGIDEGVAVEERQVLARLRTDSLEPRIAEAAADLELRREELAELDAGTRPEEIAEVEADLASSRADLETYTWKLEVAERLRQQSRETEEAVRDAHRLVATTRARIERLSATLALLRAGPREERKAQARARVRAQEAVVARLDDEKARHEIRAPFAGVVVERLVEPGTWVAPGSAVADLVDLTHLDVDVPVLEDDVASLRVGLEVGVEVDALPGRFVAGVVHRLMPVVDAKSRTLPVRVRLPGRDDERGRLLRPGMFARVHFAVGPERTALVVPKDAIVLGGRDPLIYLVDATTSTVRPVVVRLGVTAGEDVEVQGPLAAGDSVIVRGNERVFPGTPVRPEPMR